MQDKVKVQRKMKFIFEVQSSSFGIKGLLKSLYQLSQEYAIHL